MPFGKKTADDMHLPERKLLPEGIYPVTITKVNLLETKASQGMLIIHLSPTKKVGDPKSATDADITHMLLSDDWADDTLFREVKRERLAAKAGCDVEQIGSDELEAELAATKQRAQQSMVFAANAIFGRDELPQVPTYDRDSKSFFAPDGSKTTAEEWRNAKKERDAVACNLISEIASGDSDVTGYVLFARVVHEEYNGQKNAKARSLFEKLPDGEKCVPTAQWT